RCPQLPHLEGHSPNSEVAAYERPEFPPNNVTFWTASVFRLRDTAELVYCAPSIWRAVPLWHLRDGISEEARWFDRSRRRVLFLPRSPVAFSRSSPAPFPKPSYMPKIATRRSATRLSPLRTPPSRVRRCRASLSSATAASSPSLA